MGGKVSRTAGRGSAGKAGASTPQIAATKKAAARPSVKPATAGHVQKTPSRRLLRHPASTSPRSPQVESKRGLILEAALNHFSRFGLHGTSLDQVAREAAISKTNLLYYFSSKEELYVGALQQLMDVWLYSLEGFTVDAEPMAAISDYIRTKLILSRDYPRESRLFCLEVMQGAPLMIDVLEQRVRPLVAAKVRVINAWIAQGRMAPCDAHHLIFSLWAITQHYADFHVQIAAVTGKSLQDPAFFEETLRNVRALVLEGIRPR